jgi:hypothetical protein
MLREPGEADAPLTSIAWGSRETTIAKLPADVAAAVRATEPDIEPAD